MTVNYTTNLALGQPVTGTESGTWGDDVNNAVTSYLDIAIAGGLSIAITTADVTLTLTQGDSAATNIGSTTAQYAILNITGAKTAARNLNVPASSRHYIINNSAATGGFLLTVRGVTPTTGITLVDGEKAIIAWNGTDYVKIASSPITTMTGVLPIANGGTNTTASPTNGGVTYGTGSAQAYSAAGTSGQVLTSAGAAAPTWSAVTGTGSVVKATSPTIATATLTGANTIQSLTVGLGAGAVADNTAVGVSALSANTTGAGNVAVGYQALQNNTGAGDNTAVGYKALNVNTGTDNTAVGSQALLTNTSGNYNIAVGNGSLFQNITGGYNTAIGYSALLNTTGSTNTAVGYSAGSDITTGSNNVVIGGYTGSAAPISATGSNWIVLSDGAGNVRGTFNSAGLFDVDGEANISGLTIGKGAGAVSSNTAVGVSVLSANTTGGFNTAVGQYALSSVLTGNYNTAVGTSALQLNTASQNTAVGSSALYSNAGGTSNTAVGNTTLFNNNSGNQNIAVGTLASFSNTTGSDNVAIGASALYSNTAYSGNIAIGTGALYSANGGSNSTVIGYSAGTTAYGGTNTFLGYSSGSAVTSGANNVIIGGYTGSAAPISATGSNWIVLSDGAGNVRGALDSAGNFLVGTTSAGTPATTSSLSVANTFGFKNRIINGALNVLQYSGVGASGGTGNASAYTCDRWIAQASAGSPSFTAAVASTTLPTSSVPQNALTITQSASSGGALAIAQRIEAINVADLHNQTVAVQLYAATSTSATVTWTAYYANTANTWQAVGSSTSITTGATSIATGTFTTSTSIALKTFTFALGTNASTNGLMIVFSISAGVSVTFTITGVQLEKGAATTAFDYRPYTTELTLASRYFGQYGTIVSTVTNTNPIVPRTAMRTNPTVSAVSVPSGTGAVYTFSSYPSTSASIGFGAAYLSTAHSVTAQGFFTLNSEL